MYISQFSEYKYEIKEIYTNKYIAYVGIMLNQFLGIFTELSLKTIVY